jgi:myo-inositol 2-dehydrogenase/D-chiro-inositol 1-dehydrogenase
MNQKPVDPASRRQFLKTSTAVIVGSALAPRWVGRAAPGSGETLRIGLIGCGGRGSGAAAQALAADKNNVLTAMADAFPDRVEKSLAGLKKGAGGPAKYSTDQVQVPEEKRFSGFDAYQKLIDSGVDVVLLATPPGFRPLHLKAAIAAGKHAFCEKPMAVDAPGVRSVLATAAEAKAKQLSLVAGFGGRYSFAYQATLQQIHEGAIGEILAIHSIYHIGRLWSFPRQPDWSDMYWQMRDWYYFTWLSGDHLVEQAVHNIDRMAWLMRDEPPVKATAHGGRQVRIESEFGHIFDHFAVAYEYANGARGFLFTRQMDGCSNEVGDRVMGTRGVCDMNHLGHQISGEKKWRYSGEKNDSYQTEHDELFKAIRSGKPINDGVRMAHSTLKAIMGRMAAYTGQTITWEQAMNSQEDLSPARYAWDQPMPMPPVAMPGKTKFA